MQEENNNQNTNVTTLSGEDELLFEEMAQAGILYGRKKSKTHPRMKKFIFATRNGFEVFDLPKTLNALLKAKSFLAETIGNRGTIMLVGTGPAAKELIYNLAVKTGFPYVTERWLGGTLTNYKTLSKRVEYYKQLKSDKAAGKLDKYTKKERVLIDKKIEKMARLFGGLENLNRLPDALFIIDANRHDIAIREAKKRNIPVVVIVNSDTDPESLDYAIPANTNSKAGLAWLINQLEKTFLTPPKADVSEAKDSDEKEENSADNSENINPKKK